MHKTNEKHKPQFPTARGIRRSCGKELYRTAKRLKVWIAPEHMQQAEELYVRKVMLNLPYIVEHGSNRKLLADWWAEHVSADFAELWKVGTDELNRAFRDAFGG